jgi:F-type H+-transporting ATPase subunit epsilon
MSFQAVIVTPEQQLLDETATQAIVPAHDGLVGILTGRAPLLVKLGLGALRIDMPGGKSREFLVDGGVAQMKDNRLTVVTNAAWAPDELDPETARAEYAEAAARRAVSPEEVEDRDRQMRRAKLKQEMAAAVK